MPLQTPNSIFPCSIRYNFFGSMRWPPVHFTGFSYFMIAYRISEVKPVHNFLRCGETTYVWWLQSDISRQIITKSEENFDYKAYTVILTNRKYGKLPSCTENLSGIVSGYPRYFVYDLPLIHKCTRLSTDFHMLLWITLWKLWITHRRISLLNLLC